MMGRLSISKVAIALFIVIHGSASLGFNQNTERPDFVSWSKEDCQKVLKRHIEVLSVTDAHWMSAVVVGGPGKILDAEYNCFVWLTEPAAKAYARLIQLKTRLTDAGAEEVYRNIRPAEPQNLTLVLFTTSMEFSRNVLGIGMTEGDKPERLGEPRADLQKSLFLVKKNREDLAAKVEKIEPLPDEVIIQAVSRLDSAYGVLLRFSKTTQDGKALVESLKDRIVISLYRLGKERKTTFDIKKFAIASMKEL
jgi:hypothetical protein